MSKLDEISKGFRDSNLSKNSYSENKSEYNVSNKNALSDGDNLGKGENNGSVGGLDDIKARKEMMSKNPNQIGGKEYNISNF